MNDFSKKVSRNKWNLILLISSLVIIILLIKFKILQINSTLSTGEHFNFLTIDSILAGFLFTGLGIMISGISKQKILRLEEQGYLDKYYFAIYTAIFLNILSMLAAIVMIFNEGCKNKLIFLYLEQISLLLAIIFFIKSMNNLRKIINKIRKSD